MAGQTRTMLDGYAAGARYRETVIGDSNVHHSSFGHVPIHTAIRPCGKGSNIRLRAIHASGATSVTERHRSWSWLQLAQIGPSQASF